MDLPEALELQTADGPLPGIPIAPRNGRGADSPSIDAGTQAEPSAAAGVCVPCLIARGVLILVLAGALIALVVIEQRKAQAKPASA